MYDVVGIGHALVDILAHVPEELVETHHLTKASMSLIDETTADRLYEALPPAVEVSGGSAANTVVGIASFGGKAAFIGKVKNDQLGKIFKHDIRAANVHCSTTPSNNGEGTGRCIVMVTEDAQRTMCTYLGAAGYLNEQDIDEALISSSKITYLEGYLWDKPEVKNALRKAITVTHEAKRQVAFSLSDSFCVERHREEFLDLLRHDIDILFSNEAEILSLFQVAELEKAVAAARDFGKLTIITRSSSGSLIVTPHIEYTVSAESPALLSDTTGAGDLYAGGFLYGLTSNHPLPICGQLGSKAASEVISHLGARPQVPLTRYLSS